MDTKGICGGENVVPTNISSMPVFFWLRISPCVCPSDRCSLGQLGWPDKGKVFCNSDSFEIKLPYC